MNKYRPPLTQEEIARLIAISKLDFSSYNESKVREFYLIEILKLLGYNPALDYKVDLEESFKLHPAFLNVGSKRIKLDYLFSVRKQYFWLIDAKSGKCRNPKKPPTIKKDAVYQAYFYTLHPEVNCKFFIVSNGWYLNLYDRNSLDDNCTPLLSIKHTELPSQFLELDSFVGATQILPIVKKSLLDQIEKVLGSEVRVERLDEFITEAKKATAKIRGKVESNSREYFSKGNLNTPLMDEIENGDLANSVYTIFMGSKPVFLISAVSKHVINRLSDNRLTHQFEEYDFYQKLMLEKPYPVDFPYYGHVLHFLMEAQSKVPNPVFYRQQPIEKLLSEWLDLCLFGLSDKPVQRYLWICERLYLTIVIRLFKTLPYLREETAKLHNAQLFYVPEELLAQVGADRSSILIYTIQKSISWFRSGFILEFWDEDNYELRSVMAEQRYKDLVAFSNEFDEKVGEKYERLSKELGPGWSTFPLMDSLQQDFLGDVILNLLVGQKDKFHLLTAHHRNRIKYIAELGCCHYAKEVCDLLNITFTPMLPGPTRDQARADYFNPSINQKL